VCTPDFHCGLPRSSVCSHQRLARYVAEGKLRYVLQGDSGPPGSDPAVRAWVKAHGTVADTAKYGGSGTAGGLTLYRLG